jgi:hypothetical protein
VDLTLRSLSSGLDARGRRHLGALPERVKAEPALPQASSLPPTPVALVVLVVLLDGVAAAGELGEDSAGDP